MSSKAYFDQVADQWDAMRSAFFPPATRDKAFSVAQLQPGKIAADIGAGTGFMTEGLLSHGLSVIAVDQSQSMLDEMAKKFGSTARVDYRLGESEHLPISDETVDYVFANMYLHHVEQPAQAIREMARILKPGGRLVITDLDEHHFEFLVVEQHDRWMGFKRTDVQRWFEEAGLRNAAVDCTDTNCCSGSKASSEQAKVSIFVASGTKPAKGNVMSTDSTSAQDIHAAVREHYGAIARSSGSCCGSSAESCNVQLYDSALVAGLPVDVTGLSLGCGDPVSIASLKPGETVLDLGSGGGIDCFLSARQVGPSGHVIGVDMTPAMLEKANANKAKMGVTNVEFRQGQIEALPVDSNTVDVIMSNCVINLSPDKAAVFREAFRVLKPGGRVSISDVVTEGAFSPEMRADAEQWAGCVSGAIDVNDYTGLMRAAGFVDIQVVNKISAEEVIEPRTGMPRVYSARITAYKPGATV